MGQIIGSAAKPKRCNANQLSQVPTPAAGEHILVSSDNSMNAAGQGNFDAYVVGDGQTAATGLELKNINGNIDSIVNHLLIEVDGEEEVNFDLSIVNTVCYISSSNAWQVNNTNSTGDIIPVSDYRGRTAKIVANATDATYYSFVTAAPVAGGSVSYCQGYTRIAMIAGEVKDVVIPNDAVYLWFSRKNYAHNYTPQSITLVGSIGIIQNVEDIEHLKEEVDGKEGVSINPTELVSNNYYIGDANQWLVGNTNSHGKIAEVIAGRTIKIVANSTSEARVAFTRGATPVANANVDYATGETGKRNILAGQELVMTIPSDAVFLWFATEVYSHDYTPASIEILPVDGVVTKVNEAVADIAELQSKKLDVSVGKNKYSNPSLVAGYFLTSDGSLAANSTRSYSDFIPLEAETTYHISAHNDSSLDDNTNVCHIYYDAGKNYIGSTPAPTKTITTPTGTAYIRLSGYSSKFEQNVQIELGSERTDYEQYSPIGGYITMPDIVSDFNPLIGKKVLCLGDSITEFVGEGDKGYPNYLADMSSANVLKAGIGGSWLTARRAPVATPTSVNEARAAFDVCNLVNAWVSNDFTQVDAANTYLIGEGDDNTSQVNVLKNNAVDSVDVVIVFAGTNDFNNGVDIGTNADNALNTICGAYRNIINSLCTANKSLRIFIFTPIVRYFTNERTDANWSDNYQNADGKTLRDYADAIVSVANNEHIAACNLYDTLGWNKYNFSNYFLDNDGTHPYKGFEPLARRIYSFICSNY